MVEPQGRQNIVRRLGALSFALYASAPIAQLSPDEWRFIAFDEALSHVPQQRWLEDYAKGRPIDLLTGDYQSQFAAAQAGLGVALLPCVMAESGKGLFRAAPEQPDARPIWMVIHIDLRNSPVVQAVAAVLVDAFARSR